MADATSRLLGPERLRWLRQLPLQWRAGDMLLVHATPDDLERAPALTASADELQRQFGGQGVALVVYGHTHRPGVRRISDFTLANSGSVGQPYDGDWRASYLLIDDGRVEVRRVTYDPQRELADLAASDYPFAASIFEMRRRGEYLSLPATAP